MSSFRVEHELHKRRFGRNMGLLVVLGAFVALVFGLTIVKVGQMDGGVVPNAPATSEASQ